MGDTMADGDPDVKASSINDIEVLCGADGVAYWPRASLAN